eukprot:284815368_6
MTEESGGESSAWRASVLLSALPKNTADSCAVSSAFRHVPRPASRLWWFGYSEEPSSCKCGSECSVSSVQEVGRTIFA